MKRQPQGVPVGGQFAADRKAEPAGSLNPPQQPSTSLGDAPVPEAPAVAKELNTQYRGMDGTVRDLRQIIVDGGETKVSRGMDPEGSKINWYAHRDGNGRFKITQKLAEHLQSGYGFTDESDDRMVKKFHASKIGAAQAKLAAAQDRDRRHMNYDEDIERALKSGRTAVARALKAGAEETGLSEDELAVEATRMANENENMRRDKEGLSRFQSIRPSFGGY